MDQHRKPFDAVGKSGRSQADGTSDAQANQLDRRYVDAVAGRHGPPMLVGEALYSTAAPAPPPLRRRNLIRQILRYRWSVLLVTAILAGPPVAGIWAVMKPQYEATGQIRVRPIIPQLVFRTEETGRIPFYASYLNTQVGIVCSPPVLLRTLDLPQVKATAWYNRPAPFWVRKPRSRLERLASELNVRPRGRTELIDISIRTPVGADSAAIVNGVLEEYVKYATEMSSEGSDKIFHQLADECSALRAEIDHRQDTLSRLRKRLGTGDPEQLVARMRLRLDETEARLTDVRRTLAIARWKKKILTDRLSDTESSTDQFATASKYCGDPQWDQQYLALRSAEHRLDLARQQLGPAHPAMVALVKELEFARRLLREREAQLDRLQGLTSGVVAAVDGAQPTLAQQLEATAAQIALLDYEAKLLAGDLANERSNWESTFDDAQVLANELAAMTQKKQLYEAVRSRLERKAMERKVPGSIEVLAQAVAPAAPTRDRRALLSALTIFVALAAGVGLASLRAGANPLVEAGEEFSRAGVVPFLGYLPRAAGRTKRTAMDDPLVKEGIRMVRAPLLQRMHSRGGNILLVTSPGAREGKTTVAIMLARSLARCGKKVLLVDADLRNPCVGQRLGVGVEAGFMETLTGRADLANTVVPTDHPRLNVLVGSRAGNDLEAECIANGALATAAARWRNEYDVVLLDSAPVLLMSDACILAGHADGTILVLRGGRTGRSAAIHTLSQLTLAGGTLWGAVCIGASRRRYYD